MTAPNETAPAPPARRWGVWRVARLFAPAVICYGAIVALMLFFENKLLYHPTPADHWWAPPPVGLTVEDVWLTTVDGHRLHAWWCPKPGAESAVLFCNGNAGNLSFRGPGAGRIQEALGSSVLLFDYPGFGKSTGKPTEAGCYAAADAAYDWLTQKVLGERVILWGESLGTGVAVDVASRRPYLAMVLQMPYTSIPDVAQSLYPFIPARWLMGNRFDSLAKIGQCRKPLFVAHGDCDELIPFAQAQKLYTAAPEPKRFFTLAGCGHNDAITPACLADLADFLFQTSADAAVRSAGQSDDK
jgi:hypothetical protein